MPTKHTPTPEQAAAIAAVAGQDSVMIDALAGCSKTTTLEMAAPGVRVPALGLAFNSKNAKELAPRMPGNFQVKTFNGLGFGAAQRGLPPGTPKATVEERKLGKLVTQVAKDRKVDLSSEQWDELRRLVTRVMMAGITPGDRGRPLRADTWEQWAELADDLWITPESFDFLYEMAREVLTQDIALVEKQGVFSFDDQIYYSTCIAGQFPRYPVIFTDESQDLSPMNHEMVRLSLRDDGRLVAVGDPKQAIYAFRGADSNSMNRMRKLRQQWIDRPLLTTFRCPKAIVARQQEHAPGYTAWHTNTEGAVHRLTPGKSFVVGEGWRWSNITNLLPHPHAKIMVICRNNGPLLSLAFSLIRAGVGCYMLGRDIGKGLIGLSKKILPDDNTPVDLCVGKIREWETTEKSLALANDHEEKVAGIVDRAECLLAVCGSGCRDSGELRVMLHKLFSREAGQVELSSGHRAKGMESEVVVHLDPWRIPSKHAVSALAAGDPGPMQQERNLRYVIETRTKHTYIEVNLEDFGG